MAKALNEGLCKEQDGKITLENSSSTEYCRGLNGDGKIVARARCC